MSRHEPTLHLTMRLRRPKVGFLRSKPSISTVVLGEIGSSPTPPSSVFILPAAVLLYNQQYSPLPKGFAVPDKHY